MLERIREGAQGPWAMIIIALIVLSFVFAGVGSYLGGSTQTAVAAVNGVEIQQNTLERAYQNERARIENQFGEGVAALFANPDYLAEFRQGVLDRLIGEQLVEQKAVELGLRVSDEQIRVAIRTMPEFQVGGQFNNDRYLAIIQQAGFQTNDFRDYMRAEMTREQLARALAGSDFALPSEVTLVNDLQNQTRDIQVLNISADLFEPAVELTDADVSNYYQANIDRYDTQEQVALAYVELTVSDLLDNVDVSEEEVAEYYNLNQRSYMTEEERRASHILVDFGEDEAVAEQTAQALLERVNGGEDFAEVAKTESQDAFSAENGGDLDFFGRDIMDPAFEEAAFGLANVGDVSGVVRSDFGFHIIKLTDIKPESITPLEEVSAEVMEMLRTDKATELFYSRQQEMAELAFEVPDTLEDVAGVAGKTVATTDLFARGAAPAQVNYPEVVVAAFSSELIDEGVNSDVIEISEDRIIVVRATQHEPQRTKTLEEVTEEIQTTLRGEKAQQLALEVADNIVNQLTSVEDATALLEENQYTWESFENVTRNTVMPSGQVIEQAFTLGTEAGQNVASVAKTDGNVSVVQVLNVTSPEAPAEQQAEELGRNLSSTYSQAYYESFIAALRSNSDVQIFAQ
jgi:peptidyl-prolyl cis-trans isomerase D